jgi:hypothetical protein
MGRMAEDASPGVSAWLAKWRQDNPESAAQLARPVLAFDEGSSRRELMQHLITARDSIQSAIDSLGGALAESTEGRGASVAAGPREQESRSKQIIDHGSRVAQGWFRRD